MDAIDDLSLSLLVLIAVRFVALLVFLELLIRKQKIQYRIISLGWLIYMMGPIFGLFKYQQSGDSNHPMFGYSAAVGTLLLMIGVLLYHIPISIRRITVLLSVLIFGFGLFFILLPDLSGYFAVLSQLIMVLLTLVIVVFKKQWFISISGISSYNWLQLMLILSVMHALGFFMILSETPISIRFGITFLINLIILIFFLHFDGDRSFRQLLISEAKIKDALKEKETLLHEIHHRVKNNMQVFASLLNLQILDQEDFTTKAVLKENLSRIYTMSAIHESLYESEKLSEVEFKSFLHRLTRNLLMNYSGVATFKIECPDIKLNIDIANPLGMAVNEIFTNALKYAFPEKSEGKVFINLEKRVDNEIVIINGDDGIGLPKSLDWKTLKSLGFRLIRDLVQNQLNGSLALNRDNGTVYTIKFITHKM